MDEFEGLPEELQVAIQKTRHRMIETVGKNMDLFGVTQSVGHLYGMMYFSQGPVTLDEMGQKMGMSKTSMSTGMRTLMDLKMVNKVWSKGSRKDLYETEPDWHQNLGDYFSIRWRKSLESNVHHLHKSLRELQILLDKYGDDPHANNLIKGDMLKMQHALSYYKWLEKLIRSFETGDIFAFLPKEEE
ncbi:GbsR/MarR family transcriptional regulator [Brevibacterium sp. JNUCC-42]|nr:GbsR/MarR family transcriptional regulator [Brevibacterium sp. JNUCC-42]